MTEEISPKQKLVRFDDALSPWEVHDDVDPVLNKIFEYDIE